MRRPSSLGGRFVNGSLLLLAVSLIVAGACSPAMPTVDRSTLWMDTVKHGDMVREVRGAGRLNRTEAGEWGAVLRIPETQTFDLEIGQPVRIDLRVAVVGGRVAELSDIISQGTLDVLVELTGELPENTRPGLSVDGTIEIETLTDVLYVGKPAYSRAGATAALFKVLSNGENRAEAVRVPVQFGPSSVNLIVVQDGLEEGDEIILSDMSRYDVVDRVRLGTGASAQQ